MYLKIMGNENAPDCDSRKSFRIFEVEKHVQFSRNETGHAFVAFRIAGEGEDGDLNRFMLTENAYVMNDSGKTIASFGAGKIPGVEYHEVKDPAHL